MKITMYELLGMVKDGKAPKKVKYSGIEYEFNGKDYINEFGVNLLQHLTYAEYIMTHKIEILEEEPKVQVELTEKEYLECLNKINKNIKIIRDYIPKPSFLKLEEEKKIPEKLKIEQDGQTYNNFYITNQNGTKCALTKHSKMIAETLNQVIDYIKSKGDE